MNRSARWPALAALTLAVVVGLCYANALRAPFEFDDYLHIVDNPAVRDVHSFLASGALLRSNRAVAQLTFALQRQIRGFDLLPLHLVNVAIHAANALLVFLLARRVLATALGSGTSDARTCAAALLGAVLFAVHPVQTQAVTYVVQRHASLATFFYLLALWLYTEARAQQARGAALALVAAALVATVLAMKTKEIALTLPFAIALYEAVFGSGRAVKRLALVAVFLPTLAIVPLSLLDLRAPLAQVLASAQAVSRAQTTLDRTSYFLTELGVIVRYLGLLVYPADLALEHDVPISSRVDGRVLLAGLFLSAIAGGAVIAIVRGRASASRAARLGRVVGFGVLLFFLALSLESSVIPILDLMADHRLYLPSAGLALAMAALALLAWPEVAAEHRLRAVSIAAAATACVLALGVATHVRNEVWGDPVTLWRDTVAKSPLRPRPHLLLGEALKDRGDLAAAVAEWERAVELDPRSSNALNQLGAAALLAHDPARARRYLERAVSSDAANAEAHFNLAIALDATGDPVGAAEQRAAYARARGVQPW